MTKSAHANSFFVYLLFERSNLLRGFFSADYFGSACFVPDWVFTDCKHLLFCKKAGTRTKCSMSWQMVCDGSCNYFYELQPYSNTRTSLRCFQVILFREKKLHFVLKFFTVMSLYDLHVFWRRFTIHPQKILINSFGQDWRKEAFTFLGNSMDHLESTEILCTNCPKVWMVSRGQG